MKAFDIVKNGILKDNPIFRLVLGMCPTLATTTSIENGVGKVRIGDGVWKVSGPALPAGATVRVTGVDGAVLTVQQAEQG